MNKNRNLQMKLSEKKMQPPPEKKRKTARSTNAEQLWDDDFTEDDLGTIDLIEASQQEVKDHKPLPGTSSKMVGKGTMKSRSTNDMTSLKYGTSKMTSGYSAMTAPGRGSGDGLNVSHLNHKELRTESELASSNSTSRTAQVESGADKVILRLQEECLMFKDRAKKIQIEQYAKDGHIKILQAKVTEKESELLKLKLEKNALMDQQTKENNEKEKSLERQIVKLQTQLQFKEQEILEISQRFKSTENMLNRLSATSEDVNQTRLGTVFPASSPLKSAASRTNSHSPKSSASGAFPTSQSFRAEHLRSPSSKKTLLGKDKGTQATSSEYSHHQLPKMCLKITNPKGQVSGPQLVLKLMNSQMCALDRIPQKKYIEEDQRHLASSSSVSSCPTTTSPDRKSSLSSEETNLPSSMSTESTVQNNTLTLIHTINSLLQINSSAGLSEIRKLLQTEGQNATLLLPIISQNVELYSDFLTRVQDTSAASPSTASFSGPSTMTDSFTPSDVAPATLSDLSSDNLGNIGAMETVVMVMLKVLRCLVQYSHHIRESLLAEDVTGGAVTNVQTDLSKHILKNTASTSKVDETRADCDTQPQLMLRLCSLANPTVLQTRTEATSICIISLDILASLFESAPESSLKKFATLPLGDVLLGCVPAGDGIPSKFTLAASMFRLLNCLVREKSLLNVLCSQSEDCLLENIYQACVQTVDNLPPSERSALQYKLVQVLSTALSSQKFGSQELCNPGRDCQCTEVVKNVVLILHEVAVNPTNTNKERDADLLRQGTSLLQALSLTDKEYTLRHQEVEPQYVQLVCGLEEFYRTSLPNTPPIERAVTHDLWDFKQDLPSEEDEQEDSQERHDSHPQASRSSQGQSVSVSRASSSRGRDGTDSPRNVRLREQPMDVSSAH